MSGEARVSLHPHARAGKDGAVGATKASAVRAAKSIAVRAAKAVTVRATKNIEPKRKRGRPRKTLDERDEGNRRGNVVKAAARLFRKQGFDATTTRDIAAAAGMHSGSPFYHFKSKHELLFAVMEQGMQAAQARLDVLPIEPRDPAGALRLLIRTHLDTLFGPGRDFIPVMLYEARSLSARQRAAIARAQRDYEAVWVPVLQALARTRRLRAQPKLARLLIFGALNWTVQWFNAKKEASLDDLADAALALFIRDA